jgi:nucleoid-associated protein EbfC
MFGGMKGMGDIMKLMGQLPKMKENLEQAQVRAKSRTVTGESGGGLVKVEANGIGEILTVKIDPEVFKDPDTVGPLVASATNLALRKGKEAMAEEAKTAMGGMDLPPGMI